MTWFLRAIRIFLKRNCNLGSILKITAVQTAKNYRCSKSLATLMKFAVVVDGIERRKRTRTVSKAKYDMSLDSKAQHYLNALKVRWMELHEIPGLFAYQLDNNRPGRLVPGKHKFYVELNADRSTKRRAPQTIDNLNPTFKPNMFNFNKVDALEVMLTIDMKDDAETQMIINKSPITKFHSLVCPEIKNNLVQRVTHSALSFCICFMQNIDDKHMRMGYNSPGALASVNHLHFHLLHMPRNLYIDNVQLELLASDYVYRLSKNSATEAICFVFSSRDEEQQVVDKIDNVYEFTEWLCKENLPHNLFITKDWETGDLRLFVFVRTKFCVNKDITAFNVGFCELVGFIPLSSMDKLASMTEKMVIDRIRDVTGNAYDVAYEQVKHITNGTNPWLSEPNYHI